MTCVGDFIFGNRKAKYFMKQRLVGFVIRIDFGLLKAPPLVSASLGMNTFVFNTTIFFTHS